MKSPIFMLGTGRCGSTLLQRILNTSEEIIIWGEHAAFLQGLAKSYFVLAENQLVRRNIYRNKSINPSCLLGSFDAFDKSINWTNSFNREIVDRNYKKFICSLMNEGVEGIDVNKIHWGFKEILYVKGDRVIDMLFSLFPDASLILSVRHPSEVIRSMVLSWSGRDFLEKQFEHDNPSEVQQRILNYARRWNNVASSFIHWKEIGLKTHIVRYEDLIANPRAVVQKTFDSVEVPFSENAMVPMGIRLENSQKSHYISDVKSTIKAMDAEIWSIVGQTAKYFNYDVNREM